MSVERRWSRRRGVAGFVVAVGVTAAAVGCTTGSGPGRGEDEELCDALAGVRSSVTALGEVDVISEGADALSTAGNEVVVALRVLQEAADDHLGDEVDGVGVAVDELAAALAALPATSSVSGQPGTGITDVDTAIDRILVATDDLGDALQADC